MPSATPNSTLYVKNIDSKVKKPGAFWNGSADTELRHQLYYLFGSYGKVLDVVATRADGMRGQAFVVFRDLQSATAALRALEGFEFYQKPLVRMNLRCIDAVDRLRAHAFQGHDRRRVRRRGAFAP